MNFSLSNEHLMVQKMVRDFAQKEVAPVIKEYDRKGEPIPWVLDRMGELGILGICFPIKYGGQGMDYISLGLACEELEAVDSTLRVGMSVHVGLSGMTHPAVGHGRAETEVSGSTGERGKDWLRRVHGTRHGLGCGLHAHAGQT